MKCLPLLWVVGGVGSSKGYGGTSNGGWEKKIVGESKGWEMVESEVSGGEKEKDKFSMYRIKFGISIHHYILRIKSLGVWYIILCPIQCATALAIISSKPRFQILVLIFIITKY